MDGRTVILPADLSGLPSTYSYVYASTPPPGSHNTIAVDETGHLVDYRPYQQKTRGKPSVVTDDKSLLVKHQSWDLESIDHFPWKVDHILNTPTLLLSQCTLIARSNLSLRPQE